MIMWNNMCSRLLCDSSTHFHKNAICLHINLLVWFTHRSSCLDCAVEHLLMLFACMYRVHCNSLTQTILYWKRGIYARPMIIQGFYSIFEFTDQASRILELCFSCFPSLFWLLKSLPVIWNLLSTFTRFIHPLNTWKCLKNTPFNPTCGTINKNETRHSMR